MKMWVIDTECYKNFWLMCAKNIHNNQTKVWTIDNLDTLKEFMAKEKTIGFNSLKYDLPMIMAAIQCRNESRLKLISDSLIISGKPHWEVMRQYSIRQQDWEKNHIDLIEVSPGKVSLKLYGGRLNAPKLQDLPYEPDHILTDIEKDEVIEYCFNDLELTALLFEELSPQLKLRNALSKQYGINLRSKSDAQIAEAIIKKQVEELTRYDVRKQMHVAPIVTYTIPSYVEFLMPQLQELLSKIKSTEFRINDKGSIQMPDWMVKEKISIGDMQYKLGIGGLHSCEKKRIMRSGDRCSLIDLDVASYYPSIIRNLELAPANMGNHFKTVYQNLIESRLIAKRQGDKTISDTLKIVLNGSFGKFGNKYSALYSPKLLIQTTITGQLLLLMLIEKLFLEYIDVVSANTDGIVVFLNNDNQIAMKSIVEEWEKVTNLSLERTDYKLLASRDVNNYYAIKTDNKGKGKGKGIFTSTALSKNPANTIIYDAVIAFMTKDIPLSETIKNCSDLTKFVTVRTVKGGAIWNGEYLGKVVRFYKSNLVDNICIEYKTNGNKVPKSSGVRPCMVLPAIFPCDVDYDYYVAEANKILKEIGYAT